MRFTPSLLRGWCESPPNSPPIFPKIRTMTRSASRKPPTPPHKKLSFLYGFSFLVVLLVSIFIPAYNVYNSYPNVQEKCQLQQAFPSSNMFCETEALEHVKKLSEDIGNRLVGTAELRETEHYLLKVLRNTVKTSRLNKHIDIQLQVQHTSGSFLLEKFIGHDLLQAYDNLTNIVVRIDPQGTGKFSELDPVFTNQTIDHVEGNRNALLVNSHYDSAIGSPGATDDGVPTAVMLSLFKSLVTSQTAVKAPVVLLFNGCEEFGMQAAHGFISQHEWSKDIKTIINLESCGGGEGRPMLFQAGPGHAYAVRSYASVTPYAQASVIAQDMIHFLPADTDYRVFIKHLNYHAAGIDLAYTRNGFVYHTSKDSLDQIKPGAVQHMGETVFNMVYDLTENYLAPDKLEHIPVGSEPVFLDIWGLRLLVWEYSHQEYVMLGFAALLALAYVYSWIQRVIYAEKHVPATLFDAVCVLFLISVVISFIFAFVACLLLAVVLIQLDQTMSWYPQNWLAFGLYASTFVGAFLLVHYIFSRQGRRILRPLASASKQNEYALAEQAQFWALEAFLGALTLILHLLGMRTCIIAFSFMVILPLPFLAAFVHPAAKSPVVRAIIGIAPLSAYQFYSTLLMGDAAWPFFGRMGNMVNAEIACASATAAFAFFNLLHILPYLQHVRRYYLASFFAFLVTAGSLVVCFQTLDAFSETRPRRFGVNHVRYVDGETGLIEKSYITVGAIDSYPIAPALDPLYDTPDTISWESSSKDESKRDFSTSYPLNNFVTAAKLSYANGTENGKKAPVKFEVDVVEDSMTGPQSGDFTWKRTLRVSINTNTALAGHFTILNISSPYLKSWSLEGDISRDEESNDSIFVRMVGTGVLEFDMHLERTILNANLDEEGARDQMRVLMNLDSTLSRRDEELKKLHAYFLEKKIYVSELVMQQYNTNWEL